MTIETLKKRFQAAFEMHETTVERRGDYCRITIELRHHGELVGFFPLNTPYSDIDLEAIKKQCTEVETKNIVMAVYIMKGTSIILPDAFSYYNMKEVVIPGSVNAIRDDAFSCCHYLEKVIIEEGVQNIGRYVFHNCPSLKSVKIADSVEEIGDSVFSDCKSLTDVTLPPNLKYLPGDLFTGCSSLKSFAIPKSISVIGREAFKGCVSLKKVQISEGVTSIGEEAFAQCDSLMDIMIPSHVRYIGIDAFAGCKSLLRVLILSKDIRIGQGAFSNCPALENVTFSRDMLKMDEIPDYMLGRCPSLKDFSVPSTVKKIGSRAFTECSSLSKIKLPQGVETIGEDAFNGCTSLQNVKLPSTVSQIGAGAFWKTSITIPIMYRDVLTYVPRDTSGKFIVPQGIKKIEASAFQSTDITDIILPDTITEIGSRAFKACYKLKSVAIPSGVRTIEEETFSECEYLVNVTLPETLLYIKEKAFNKCALQRLVLPKRVSSIEREAFGNCKALSELTISGPIAVNQIDNSAFYECTALQRVNLPAGLSWKKLKHRFFNTPWVENQMLNSTAAAAKRRKLEELENAAYRAFVEGLLPSDSTRITVNNDSMDVLAQLPGNSFIVAKIPLTDSYGVKIPVTKFNCDTLKRLIDQAKPDTTYWLYPQGTVIDNRMTQNTRGFTQVTANLVLLDGITGIDYRAFEGHKGLRLVSLPETITFIKPQAFSNTDLEEAIIFNDRLNCAPLGSKSRSYAIPEGVRHIDLFAFKGCKTIEEVIVPASVETIETNAFIGCDSLKRVVFANPVKIHSFATDRLNQTQTEKVEGFTLIDYRSFEECPNITDFVVPNSAAFLGSIISAVGVDWEML